MSHHTRARIAVHLKDMLDHVELTDGHVIDIVTDNSSSNHSLTCELQSTLVASGIEWQALRNNRPCMAHTILLALDTFMSSLGVKDHTKSWEAHQRDHQCGENKSIDIGMSQRLRKEGNTRINKLSALRPGLANIFEKVRIS
jgi:hypothetical protein